MTQLTHPHINLIRLLAKQAVAEHLTAQSKANQGSAPYRPNPPVLRGAGSR